MSIDWTELVRQFRAEPRPRWRLTTVRHESFEGVVTHIPATDASVWSTSDALYFSRHVHTPEQRPIGERFVLRDIVSLQRID